MSGDLLVKQADYYLNIQKRLELAKLFVEGAANNILKVLAYYKIENNIKETLSELNSTNKITEIMNIEGRFARNIILNLMKFFPMILKWKADPDNLLKNMINSLISFWKFNDVFYSFDRIV